MKNFSTEEARDQLYFPCQVKTFRKNRRRIRLAACAYVLDTERERERETKIAMHGTKARIVVEVSSLVMKRTPNSVSLCFTLLSFPLLPSLRPISTSSSPSLSLFP